MMLILPGLAILLAPAIWLILGRPRILPIAELAISSDNKSNQQSKKPSSSISIIIPARNEQCNIANLLDSINQQSLLPAEVIVVDDHSSDNTANIATELGAHVISSEPLPSNWMGKPWACQQGAASARYGNWLLFLDADLTLEPEALASLQQLANTTDSVHSVCPYHQTKKLYEQLSAFFNVLMLAGVNAFGRRSNSTNQTALFGQCMLISKEHYQQVNGHNSVKNKTLENFHLARELQRLNITCSCYLGKGSINMRMFPNGFQELWLSWKKGFSGAASHTKGHALLLCSLWITSMMLTIVCLIVLLSIQCSPLFASMTTAVYLIHTLQCLIVFKLAGRFSLWNALLFPVSLLFYQVLFFSSVIDKKRGKAINWKGRQVH
ncbi:MAG: glycosyltransferase [Akkermansiaceae bacterium]